MEDGNTLFFGSYSCLFSQSSKAETPISLNHLIVQPGTCFINAPFSILIDHMFDHKLDLFTFNRKVHHRPQCIKIAFHEIKVMFDPGTLQLINQIYEWPILTYDF